MTTQYRRKLQKHESGIIGGWLYENGNVRADDNTLRIEWLVENYLIKIGAEDGGWTTNYEDPEDGRCWQRTYPKSFMHGGGPPMLEQVTTVTIAYKHLKQALLASLKAKLYDQVIEERHDFEVFGSRYIVWSNHQRAIRLIWDGRDYEFVLEGADVLSLSEYTLWHEIDRCSFNPKLDEPSQMNHILTQMNNSLIMWRPK